MAGHGASPLLSGVFAILISRRSRENSDLEGDALKKSVLAMQASALLERGPFCGSDLQLTWPMSMAVRLLELIALFAIA